MRVVLDTNVLMSAVYFGGVPGRLLSAWASKHFTLVLSPDIFDEYRRVGHELARRYPGMEESLEPLLALISMNAIIVDAQALERSVSLDSDDDKFLACAVAARTKLIVSGDKHLLKVSGWRGIEVLTPRQFFDRYLNKKRRPPSGNS